MNTEIKEISINQATQPGANFKRGGTGSVYPINGREFIEHWQPMGIRVVVNLPFINDDKTPLFAIRVTPFIPLRLQNPAGTGADPSQFFCPVYPLPKGSRLATAEEPVTVTIYDQPPPLSVISQMYRFWRGSMKYRIRTVTNFLTNGYVIAGIIKATYADEIHDRYSENNKLDELVRGVYDCGFSYQKYMQNSYVMSDLSMSRHMEVEVPYEHELPYRDMFRFIEGLNKDFYGSGQSVADEEMHDFLVVSARGLLSSPAAGGQITFELEYAAGQDFQLSCERMLYNDLSASLLYEPPPFVFPKLPASKAVKEEEEIEESMSKLGVTQAQA